MDGSQMTLENLLAGFAVALLIAGGGIGWQYREELNHWYRNNKDSAHGAVVFLLSGFIGFRSFGLIGGFFFLVAIMIVSNISLYYWKKNHDGYVEKKTDEGQSTVFSSENFGENTPKTVPKKPENPSVDIIKIRQNAENDLRPCIAEEERIRVIGFAMARGWFHGNKTEIIKELFGVTGGSRYQSINAQIEAVRKEYASEPVELKPISGNPVPSGVRYPKIQENKSS